MSDAGDTRSRRLTRRREVPTPDEGHAGPPHPLAPSGWLLPDPAHADEDGVVGVGADLAPSTLVDAYRRGIFPWPHPGVPLPWFSPDPRGVLEIDRFHVARSLTKHLKGCAWETTLDWAFPAVVAACAERRGEAGTWITPAMARSYRRLNELGWAHSVEVWDGAALVGGLYGVQVGGVFTGESMFYRESNASKVALLDLVDRFAESGGSLLDVQIATPHLTSLGAREMRRGDFLKLLHEVREDDVRLPIDRRPVARLAEGAPKAAKSRRGEQTDEPPVNGAA